MYCLPDDDPTRIETCRSFQCFNSNNRAAVGILVQIKYYIRILLNRGNILISPSHV